MPSRTDLVARRFWSSSSALRLARKAAGTDTVYHIRSLDNVYRALERAEKKYAKRGHDLVIEVSESDAKGWDEDNYAEAPAPDVVPILVPWSDETSRVYYFIGNTVQGGEAKKARKRK